MMMMIIIMIMIMVMMMIMMMMMMMQNCYVTAHSLASKGCNACRMSSGAF
jgi:hypothetical protein